MTSIKPHRPKAGFTLIELMVVLFIIAMGATLILPNMVTATRKAGLASTGNQLCELLNFAYISAITQHRQAVVNFDLENRRCWVSMNTTQLPWLENSAGLETRRLESLALPPNLALSVFFENTERATGQTWDTITFTSRGAAETARIELVDAKQERYVIEVFGPTGEVHGGEAPRL